MPQVSDATTAFHDRHDPMLVAALAAGDLAGTERDQAVALTTSCTECAALHADLVAIARATATLPPPLASAGRDFRLTPAQAASLRRTGWRRLVPSIGFSTPLTRPLGIALATFGIAGLLIGTLPLGGTTGSASTSAGAGAQEPVAVPAAGQDLGPVPAASAAFAASAAAASNESTRAGAVQPPAGSAAPVAEGVSKSPPSPAPGAQYSPRGALSPSAAFGVAGPPVTGGGAAPSTTQGEPAATQGPSPLALVSIIAIVLGVSLVILSATRRRATA